MRDAWVLIAAVAALLILSRRGSVGVLEVPPELRATTLPRGTDPFTGNPVEWTGGAMRVAPGLYIE